MSEINEEKIDEIWNEINSEEKEKQASEELDIDNLINDLEKTASKLDEDEEEIEVQEEELTEEEEDDAEELIKQMLDKKKKKKEANRKDVETIDKKGVGGKLTLRSNNASKQRLMEILYKGLKEGESDEKYEQLREALVDNEKEASAEKQMVEKLSDKIADKILNGEL